MRFCNRAGCNNILTSVIKNEQNTGNVKYVCLVCYEEYDLEPSDTLMIDEFLQETESVAIHRNYLRNAHDDEIIDLEKKDCINKYCSQTIMNVVKLFANGHSLYVCPTCRTQFN